MTKNGEKTPTARLKAILHDHVALGVESIFSCFFSARNPKKLAFHHILNRIMVMAQVPIMFVVLRNLDGEYPEFYISNKHKNEGHQEKIRKRICDLLKNRKEWDKYLIPLWHGKIADNEKAKWLARTTGDKAYHLLVLEAYSAGYDFTKLRRIEKTELVMSPVDAAMYCIEKMFSHTKYLHYGESFFQCLSASLATIAFGEVPEVQSEDGRESTPTEIFWLEFLGKTSAPTGANHDRLKNARKNCREVIRSIGTPYSLVGESVLDRTFGNLKGSIDSLSHGAAITNCLLFTRSFDRPLENPRRNGEYDYNVRISRGSNQSREHLEAFARWLSQEREEKERNFVDSFPEGDESVNERVRAILHEAISVFWKKTSTREGCAYLQKVLDSDFGDDARSVSEPVFEGISFFRDPFIRQAGVERCFTYEIPEGTSFNLLEEKVQADILRVIAFNFLLQDMAPERMNGVKTSISTKEKSRVYVMLNPVELGGKVWAVAAYAARTAPVEIPFNYPTKDSNGKELIPTDQDIRARIERWNGYWLRNFHTYQDVHERLKRSLRQHLKTAYYELLGRTYSQCIWAISDATSLEEVQNTINDALRECTCFFPYGEVSITVESDPKRLHPIPFSTRKGGVSADKGQEQATYALFAEHLAARIDVAPNMRYPDAPGRDQNRAFVTRSGLAVALTDAVFRQSAL